MKKQRENRKNREEKKKKKRKGGAGSSSWLSEVEVDNPGGELLTHLSSAKQGWAWPASCIDWLFNQREREKGREVLTHLSSSLPSQVGVVQPFELTGWSIGGREREREEEERESPTSPPLDQVSLGLAMVGWVYKDEWKWEGREKEGDWKTEADQLPIIGFQWFLLPLAMWWNTLHHQKWVSPHWLYGVRWIW